MFKIKKNMILALFIMFFMLLVLPEQVHAIEPMEVGKNVTLSIDYLCEKKTVKDVEFCIYKVATASEFAEFTPTEEFAKYPVAIDNEQCCSWDKLAETLAAYVERDNLKPLDKGKTDDCGKLKFPTKSTVKMTTGLYLVVGSTHKSGNYIYESKPFLVSLPERDENDVWLYDVTSAPKNSRTVQLTKIKVAKIWKDSRDTSKRPEKIEVELLCDGKEYDTVTLNKKNNWRYTWDGLEKGHRWKVVEKKVPSGYTVVVELEDDTFTLTNTLKKKKEPSKDVPKNPPKEAGKKETLPQLGLLWWPIPVLACGGMTLFTLGWIKSRKQDE